MDKTASISKRPSGKFRARVRFNGQYRNATFSGKAAAKRWAANVEGHLHDSRPGINRRPGERAVGDLIKAHREEGDFSGRIKVAALNRKEKDLADMRLDMLDAGLDQFVLTRKRKDPKCKETNDQTVPLLGAAYALAEEQAGGRKKGRLFPYNERSISASFTRACQSLGIEDLHCHDLRHAATTQFFRMGLPIQLVALITGHKSWENLRRYTQLSAADVHAALEAARVQAKAATQAETGGEPKPGTHLNRQRFPRERVDDRERLKRRPALY